MSIEDLEDMESMENVIRPNANDVEARVRHVSLLLKEDDVAGIKSKMDIDLFDSDILYKEPDLSDDYKAILGQVRGTNRVCYGIRISDDDCFFKIYCNDINRVYYCALTQKIALMIGSDPFDDELDEEFNYENIVENVFVKKQVTAPQLVEQIKEKVKAGQSNACEEEFVQDFNTYAKVLRFEHYLQYVYGLRSLLYIKVIIGYVKRNNITSFPFDKFQINAKLNKKLNKALKLGNMDLLNDGFLDMSVDELAELYHNVFEKLIEEEKVFEDFDEDYVELIYLSYQD